MIDMSTPPPSASMLTGTQASERPEYPPGLRISLGSDSLRALAIGEGTMPQVGARMMLHALVEVVAVSKSAGEADTERQVELQITTMELAPPDSPNEQQRAARQIAGMYESSRG